MFSGTWASAGSADAATAIMTTLTRWVFATAAAFIVMAIGTGIALAQPGQAADSTGGMTCHCPMAGMQGMGIAGMIFGLAFLTSVIAVLIALTVFLVRRSRVHVP
jgi:hypothetical protein